MKSNDFQVSGAFFSEIPIEENNQVSPFSSHLTVLPLYDVVAFPNIPQPVKLERKEDLSVVEHIYETKQSLLAIPVKNKEKQPKAIKDFYPAGIVCKVAKIIKLPDMTPVAFLICGPKAKITRLTIESGICEAVIKTLPPFIPDDNYETKLLVDGVKSAFQKVLSFFPDEEKDQINLSANDMDDDIARGICFMINNSPISFEEKASLLASKNFNTLLEGYLSILDLAIQKFEIQASIHHKTHQTLNQQQKNMFLQQQLNFIREELGENEGGSDKTNLLQRASTKKWSKETKARFDEELNKLDRFNTSNPEYSIQFSYLDTFLNLPWENYSSDKFTFSKVEHTLDSDHYGLEQVKDRIIEQMAVLKLRKDMKAPIICLYGPPGVGKTSIGKSIAKAMGREYLRVSLGGLHDEAEIRGHRRTYIGAMPGRIISALSKCATGNPVFVLDEIDKIGRDFKGDPSTALLEVLDPEQNLSFHDNYLDFDYDLSKIMFIATANSLSDISRPLLDRMEVIEINGYIPEEKIEIARRHLIAKCLEETGFSKNEITFTPEAIKVIINSYTHESGVRQLEKKISKVLRKIARLKASKKEFPTIIEADMIKDYLGKEEVNPDKYENNKFAGVVTGLAWTQAGGEILFIETSIAPGNGEKITLTGNLGDVMKESAIIALQYLKAHSEVLEIDKDIFNKVNFHIHVPEGAIPKDGPSAGITMATSIASALTGRKVKAKLAMTGEITLRGKVLPVGGIKEKILAAKRAGITDIILSKDNRKDIEDINSRYLKGLTFHYADTIEDVLTIALLKELAEVRYLQ